MGAQGQDFPPKVLQNTLKGPGAAPTPMSGDTSTGGGTSVSPGAPIGGPCWGHPPPMPPPNRRCRRGRKRGGYRRRPGAPLFPIFPQSRGVFWWGTAHPSKGGSLRLRNLPPGGRGIWSWGDKGCRGLGANPILGVSPAKTQGGDAPFCCFSPPPPGVGDFKGVFHPPLAGFFGVGGGRARPGVRARAAATF